MPQPTIALIDGHYYLYRMFFGMPPLTGPGGRPTGVTYGFANLVKDLKADAAITHWLAVFDIGDSFRHQVEPNYKAHRDPMPDLLRVQIADVQALLTASHVPILQIPGFEADDVLATLAKRAESQGFAVRLLSKDKDIDQVLSPNVSTWDPGKGITRGPAELLAEKGIRPDQVVDYLCMIGDTADNVPGITGVGPKTAAKLLAEYGTLDAVLANVEKLKGKQAENVRAFIPKAAHTKHLITLADVPDLPEPASFVCDRNQPLDGTVYAGFGFTLARFQKPSGSATPAPTAATAEVPASEEPYRTLTVADLPAFIAALRAAGRFAIDTETTGLDPLTAKLVGISFACGQPVERAAAYLPVLGPDGAACDWPAAQALLAPLLADATVKKVGQHAKFDARILAAHGLPVVGYDGDPMLASWLLDPSRESHGLDHLTNALLGETKIPTSAVIDLKAGQTMDQVAIPTVARYACEDAQCTWRLAQLLEAKLTEQGLLAVYRDQEIPLELCLARMEDAGIAVDPAILRQTQDHLQAYLTQTEAEIRRHAGPDFNPASPKQVAALLFEKLKLPVISSTKSGPSTDASVLEALRGQHEMPELLLQWRSLSKLIGTYLSKLPDFIAADGRIHTHYKPTGTETGRLSSDTPNLQNIPKKRDIGREIRAAFTAGPGKVLIAADYSQIELRILAHLSGDPTLRQAFADDRDIHRFVAAQVTGKDEASVTPAERNAAKAVNFGILYGQTAFGLAGQLGIPRHQAQAFLDDYFTRFATVKAFSNRLVEEAALRGYATTMAGRRRYLPQLSSSNRNERNQGERIALNTTIQGSAADLIKQAMLRCERLLPPGSRLLLQIHDELIVEADDAVAPAAAEALTTAMTGAWSLDVPLIAQARTGRTWLDVS